MLLTISALFVLINLVTVYCAWSGCPASELIKPCVCVDNGAIRCGGHSDIDLVNIFQTLEKNLIGNLAFRGMRSANKRYTMLFCIGWRLQPAK